MPSPMHFLRWPLSRRQVLGDHGGRTGLNHFLLIIKTRNTSAIGARAVTTANAQLGDKGAAGEAFKTGGAKDHSGPTAAEEEEAGQKTRTSFY